MKKSTTIGIVFGIATIIGGIIFIGKKIKDKKTIIDLPEEDFSDLTETEEETSEEVVVETAEAEEEKVISENNETETEEISDIEEEIEIDSDEVCNVAMEDETTESDTVHVYIAWLIQNDVSTEEAQSVMETISKIKIDCPEKYPEIEEKMNMIMTENFDITKSQNFDKENFITFYGNLNPRALFVTNGLKLIAMGGEANIDMQRLSSALLHLKKKNFNEFLEVMYEIYHTLNSLEVENINDKTYEENFKCFVDKYVKSNVKPQNKTKIVEDFREVKEEGETK